MLTRFTLFGFILLLITSGCNSQKKVTNPNEFNGNTLRFSSGGGFTGLTTTYTLLENGQLFSVTGVTEGSPKELSPVDSKKVKAVFASAKKIKWPTSSISHPGNMSYSITYKTAKKTHTVVWGDGNSTPPADIDIAQLYKDLTQLISSPKQ